MTKSQTLISFAAVLAIGFFLGSGIGPNASAQVPSSTTPRYQAFAYAYDGHAPSQPPGHGCYILGTATGALWHAGQDSQGKPTKVSDKLP